MTELRGPIQRFTGVLGMAQNAAPVRELVEQLKAAHTVTRDGSGQTRYIFPDRGIELVFRDGSVCEVHAHTRPAGDGSHAKFPIPPINDLPESASRQEVESRLGTPARVDAGRFSYRITGGWLHFDLAPDAHVSAISVSTLAKANPVVETDENGQDADSEPLVFVGRYSQSAGSEQVVFTDEDAELSFSRRLDAPGPLVIGWEGRYSPGGLESVTLGNDNTLIVQVTTVAATTLGLHERSSFRVADNCDAAELCEVVRGMSSAGMDPPPRRAAREPA